MKLSNDFSGALRTFAYFMASGTHYMLESVEYLQLYGEEPSAIEMVFAIFANVLELDGNGNVLNFNYAQRRATDYLRAYCTPGYEVVPPYEDWETELPLVERDHVLTEPCSTHPPSRFALGDANTSHAIGRFWHRPVISSGSPI